MNKIKVLFSLLAFIMLVGVTSCGPVPQGKGESQTVSSVEQADTDSIQLVEIINKKQGTSYAYDRFVIYKFVDDGCTYYVGHSSTNFADGGVSIDIEHSASCTNPIHKKERDKERETNSWE